MKGLDTRTSSELSELGVSTPVDARNSAVVVGDETEQRSIERASREQTIVGLRLLWEGRKFLGCVTGTGALLSILIALLIPSRYQSVARLMPPDNQSASALGLAAASFSEGAAGGLGGIASQVLGLKSSSDLVVGVLNSRTVEDKLIQKFDLKKIYGDRRMEDARKHLTVWTDIVVDRKSQIITIAVTDKNPLRAAAMAQTYVDELNRTMAEVSTSSARRERMFLEGRLQAVNQDLEAAEKEFSQFASKNTAIDIKEQGRAMVDAAATLQGQVIAARSELEGLRQLYADGNVRVRSAQARVAELEDQLRKVGGKDASASLENEAQGASMYPSIRQLPMLGVPYADLYRKTKVEEAVFETLTKEDELAKVEEAKEIPTVKVLDPPDLPEKKSFPPRTIIVLLGTALAFACGVMWAFGRRAWEQTDQTDPGKVFAREVFDSVRSAMPWTSRNGSGPHTESQRARGPADRTDAEKGVSK